MYSGAVSGSESTPMKASRLLIALWIAVSMVVCVVAIVGASRRHSGVKRQVADTGTPAADWPIRLLGNNYIIVT